ncbi:MAG: protease modulator HflC [Pseudomonadota bacterium]
MRPFGILGIVAAVIALIAVFNSFFIVDQRQQALVLQVGASKAVYNNGDNNDAGLKFKIPLYQSVVFFDKRNLGLDLPEFEVFAVNQERLSVDAFIRWRINDPLEFYRQFVTQQEGANQLENFARTAIYNRLSQKCPEEIISGLKPQTPIEELDINDRDVDICQLAIEGEAAPESSDEGESNETDGATPEEADTAEQLPDEGARTILMNNIRDDLRNAIADRGIEIIDVRLKRVELPAEITQGVFRQMIETRNQEATDKRTQGDRDAAEIRAQADRYRVEREALANRCSEQLRGQGDATRNNIYAEAYDQDREFFRFQRALIACENAFTAGTRIVLAPDNLGLCDEFIARARSNSRARGTSSSGGGAADQEADLCEGFENSVQ